MNTFVNAIANQSARTTNGMVARAGTADPVVDLFYNIGASRGKNVIPAFTAAYVADKNLAGRVALWSRDIRGGAGERKIFRDILANMSVSDPDMAKSLAAKVPELGRWDDLFALTGDARVFGFTLIKDALEKGNGLAAKWMPRKGPEAVELRTFLGWSPKRYRKTLVDLTKVVETQMCAKEWDAINFSHVPSVAASRYRKAFYKRAPEKFKAYVEELKKPAETRDPKVKVNAGAVYPYDVIKSLRDKVTFNHYNGQTVSNLTKEELDFITAQWEALPNLVGDASILTIVDVSGSMTCPAGGYGSKSTIRCLDVSVSLGMYLADKNKGPFKDTFLTFSGQPQLITLRGDIVQKMKQLITTKWEMNTNLHAAIQKVLDVAVAGQAKPEDMPKALLILSDMQFDACARYDDSAIQMIRRKYEEAGYEMPQIVFWNLNASDNVPVKYNEKGVALVSGFSPNILKSVLAADLEEFTPKAIMLKTIMSDRYAF